MEIEQILKNAIEKKASDTFLVSGIPVSYKIGGMIIPQSDAPLSSSDANELIQSIFAFTTKINFETFNELGDSDFSISLSGVGRFRVNVYRQRGSPAAVIRTVLYAVPNPSDIGIPQSVIDISRLKNGFVLVTGTAGSGKSTTLACIIDAINSSRSGHIITLEDPVEIIHRHKKSIVSQREIYTDTKSYPSALRAALRQSPDVILLGEMRDFETISIAMTAAETGQLIFSSLHTMGAAKTIDRIIDVFPPEQQQQIRLQLSMVLRAVISQHLLPSANGGLVPAFEIMYVNPAIRNLIRDNKIKQLDAEIRAGKNTGMISMSDYIHQLRVNGKITETTESLYLNETK